MMPVGIDVNLTDGKYCVISDGTEITFPKPLKSAIIKLGGVAVSKQEQATRF